MNKIKKSDQVVVITGKDKGRQAKVLKVLPNDKLLLEGINVVKKHKKPNPQKGIQGGILEKEMPIHISNVMLFDSVSNKPTRVGIKVLENGKKVRYFKRTQELVDVV